MNHTGKIPVSLKKKKKEVLLKANVSNLQGSGSHLVQGREHFEGSEENYTPSPYKN